MDADGSGSISVEELVYGMARRGAHVAREDLEALMATVDVQGDGAIDYEEFLAATVAGSKAASEDALFEAFAELDADGSGYVSAEELADKLSELGMSADPADIQKMIGDADSNNDGMIDYLEWLQLMSPGTRHHVHRLVRHPARICSILCRLVPLILLPFLTCSGFFFHGPIPTGAHPPPPPPRRLGQPPPDG